MHIPSARKVGGLTLRSLSATLAIGVAAVGMLATGGCFPRSRIVLFSAVIESSTDLCFDRCELRLHSLTDKILYSRDVTVTDGSFGARFNVSPNPRRKYYVTINCNGEPVYRGDVFNTRLPVTELTLNEFDCTPLR